MKNSRSEKFAFEKFAIVEKYAGEFAPLKKVCAPSKMISPYSASSETPHSYETPLRLAKNLNLS